MYTEAKTLSVKENAAFSIGFWIKRGGREGNLDPLLSQAFWFRVAMRGPGIKAVKKPKHEAEILEHPHPEDVYNWETPRPG